MERMDDIPEKVKTVAFKRIEGFAEMFWTGRGYVSIDSMLASAYMQGFADCVQVIDRSEAAKILIDFSI